MPFTKRSFNKTYTNIYDIKDIFKRRHFTFLLDNQINSEWDAGIKKYNADNYELIFDKTYSVYTNEFRYTKGKRDSSESYVFLGCSFTFGVGVTDDETLPYFFSKLYNFEKNIINCAVSGQSSNTALNILNNNLFLPLVNNENAQIKHFFYGLVHNQIFRNFRYENIYNINDGFLYKNNKYYIPTIVGKIKYVFARSYIFRKIFVPIIDENFNQYYENYMIKNLEEMNKIAEEKYNSKLTIIVWDKKYYSDYFIDKLKKTNLDLIILPDKFNLQDKGYRIRYDEHPTAKANEELAQILYNHINKKDKVN